MTKKEIGLDVVRVITTLLVIIGHCGYFSITTDWGGIDYRSNFNGSFPIVYTVIISQAIGLIYSFHMETFMALSGALFNAGKYSNVHDLTLDKGKRLIKPFFAVGILYSVPIKILTGYFVHSNNVFYDVFVGQFLLEGNNYLWFLPTLFTIMIISYFLKETPHVQKIVLGIILSFYSTYIPLKFASKIAEYFLWFEIGLSLRTKIHNWGRGKKSRLGFIISSIALLLLYAVRGFYNDSLVENVAGRLLLHSLNILVAFSGIACTYFVSCALQKCNLVTTRCFDLMRLKSYDLYLYSDPLNYVLLWFLFRLDFFSNFISSNIGFSIYFLVRMAINVFGALAISRFVLKTKVLYASFVSRVK